MEITGKIKIINEAEKKSDKFTLRSVIITTDEKYPQELGIDFFNEKVNELDKFKIGDNVSISVNLRGNEYKGKYYTTINGWKCAELLGNQVTNKQQNPAREETADLPF
jgi:hypothetical protein|tara:strand:+ start:4039 stop:4362 length:324 start_codon:yes stop_codon:yes gene_type:complete